MTRITVAAGSAATAFLMVGAGVAAIAEPLTWRGAASTFMPPLPLVSAPRAATVRIALPPVQFARAAKPAADGVLELTLDHIAPESAADDAALAAATIKPPEPALTSPRIALPQAATTPTMRDQLAAARAKEMTVYSPARYAPSETGAPRSNSMVGDEDWASLTSSYGPPQAAASATDRTAALQAAQPAKPARAVSGAVPIFAGPIGAEPSQLAGIDTPAKQTERVSLSVVAQLDGAEPGRASLLIRDQDNISVRLSDVLALVDAAAEPKLFDRLNRVQPSQGYVTFNDLRGAGLSVSFDKRDRLVLSKR